VVAEPASHEIDDLASAEPVYDDWEQDAADLRVSQRDIDQALQPLVLQTGGWRARLRLALAVVYAQTAAIHRTAEMQAAIDDELAHEDADIAQCELEDAAGEADAERQAMRDDAEVQAAIDAEVPGLRLDPVQALINRWEREQKWNAPPSLRSLVQAGMFRQPAVLSVAGHVRARGRERRDVAQTRSSRRAAARSPGRLASGDDDPEPADVARTDRGLSSALPAPSPRAADGGERRRRRPAL